MKISGKRLIIYVEKEWGDSLNMLRNCRSKINKRILKKTLKTRVNNYLKSIETDETAS